jgi:hypothetical protein
LLERQKDLRGGVDFSGVQSKTIREQILKETKDNYLPQLIKFPSVAKTVPLKDDENVEGLDAARHLWRGASCATPNLSDKILEAERDGYDNKSRNGRGQPVPEKVFRQFDFGRHERRPGPYPHHPHDGKS